MLVFSCFKITNNGGEAMSDVFLIFLLTLFAGITMPLGATLSYFEEFKPKWLENEFRHSVLAFGGGALLASVALVLVPKGTEGQSVIFIAVFFTLGGLAFMSLDQFLAKSKIKASNFIAMLSDFIPEALALGAIFTTGRAEGVLLSLLIALQNAPEGFNAYRELIQSKHYKPKTIILTFLLLSLLGPVAGLFGFYYLSSYPNVVCAVMLFAAGGILYIVFQDIAPQVKLKKHWGPPLGAVFGFLVGLMGHVLI